MSASIWDILGVPRGSATSDIKRAYARKLRVTNPEDDPDGFKALREAYERALAYAEAPSHWDEWDDEEEDEAASWEPGSGVPFDAGAGTGGALLDTPENGQGWTPVGARDEEEQASGEKEGGGTWAPMPGPAAPRSIWGNAPPPELNLSELDEEEPEPEGPEDAQPEQRADHLTPLLERLAALLDDPNPVEIVVLQQAFHDIVTAPELADLSLLERVEHWLARQIATHFPRSDWLIEQALHAFHWSEQDVGRRIDPNVRNILYRIEELRFVGWAKDVRSPMREGWQALTQPPVPGWRMRLEALSTARTSQVRALLDAIAFDYPGAEVNLQQERAAWWRAHLAKAPLTYATLLLAPFFALVAMLALGDVAILDRTRPFLFALAAFSLALPFLYLRCVKQPQAEWLDRTRKPPPLWFVTGWMGAAALLPVAIAILPPGPWSDAPAFALALVAMLWTAAAVPPHSLSTGAGQRLYQIAARFWWPACVFIVLTGVLPRGYTMHGVAVSMAFAFIWWRGRDQMIAAFVRAVPRYRIAIGIAAAVLIAGGALAAGTLLGDPRRINLCVMAATLAVPLLVLTWQSDSRSNKFALVLAFLGLAVMLIFVVPPPKAAPSSADTGAQPEACVPGNTRAECETSTPTRTFIPPTPSDWRERLEGAGGDVPAAPLQAPVAPVGPRETVWTRTNAPGEYIATLNAHGRVVGCRVGKTSGSAEIDRAMCRGILMSGGSNQITVMVPQADRGRGGREDGRNNPPPPPNPSRTAPLRVPSPALPHIEIDPNAPLIAPTRRVPQPFETAPPPADPSPASRGN